MQKVFLFFCVFLFTGTGSVIAQNPADDSIWFAGYFTRLSSPDEKQKQAALDSLETVGEIARQKNYSTAVNRYYIEKAGYYVSLKKTDSAIRCFEKAISIAGENRLDREAGDAYLGLANLYQFNGNTLNAAQYYLKTVKLLKDLGRKRLLISLYRNLGSVLNKLKQKNGALENMLAAIKTGKSSESNLVTIINTKNSEEEGFNFPDQALVREGGRDGIYVIFGNAKFPILNFQSMASYGASRDVQRIPAGTLALIPDIPKNGSLLREMHDGNVYIIKDSMLYLILTPEILEIYGGWDAVYFVPDGSLINFKRSPDSVNEKNVSSIFNIKQEFDNLADSISTALQKNSSLSNQLSQQVAGRNHTLQKRKIWLWVTAIGLAALLFIVMLLIRNFRQKQKVQKAEEELRSKMAVEKERTRIATDMHDDLGAGLSRIKFLSETIGMKKQLQQPVEDDINKIREYSHEMIDKMGEIVWALNEKNDSLSDLLSYTRSYAVEYLLQNGINCRINVPDNIPDYSLSGEFRRNFYLSVKEALHNIIKHAGAKHVSINIETDRSLFITISDDGLGYSGSNRPYSNGLMNMKERMKNINGTFDIINNNGTTVKLAVPLPV